MKITLVSHAETEENFLRNVLGQKNVMLNDTGRRQARNLRMRLIDENYSYCYMSPLVRDVETAMILIGDKVEMISDKRLIERNTGDFEGKTIDNYNLYKYWDYDLNLDTFGVEKISNLFVRVTDFLDYITSKYDKNSNIIIVTDFSTYRALRILLKKTPLEGKLLDGVINNCSVEVFEI